MGIFIRFTRNNTDIPENYNQNSEGNLIL